jgi:hypothetical protein
LDTYVDQTTTDAPLQLLQRVSIVLQQARLKFAELQSLLECRFVNPGTRGVVKIVPDEEYEPSKLRLENCDGPFLDATSSSRRSLGWRWEVTLPAAATTGLQR